MSEHAGESGSVVYTEFAGDNAIVEMTNHSLGDYRAAIGGEGPLAYEWSDKPHRLVYDLINEIKRLRDLPRQ